MASSFVYAKAFWTRKAVKEFIKVKRETMSKTGPENIVISLNDGEIKRSDASTTTITLIFTDDTAFALVTEIMSLIKTEGIGCGDSEKQETNSDFIAPTLKIQ